MVNPTTPESEKREGELTQLTGMEALLAAQGITVEQAATALANIQPQSQATEQIQVESNPQPSPIQQPAGIVVPPAQGIQQPQQAPVANQPAGVNIVVPTPSGVNPQATRGQVVPFEQVPADKQVQQWQVWYISRPQYSATIARFGIPSGFSMSNIPATPGNELLITLSKSSGKYYNAGWGWVVHYIEVGENATQLVKGARKTGKWSGTYEFEHEVDPSSRNYLVKFLCSIPFQHGDATTNPIPIPGTELIFEGGAKFNWQERQPCWEDKEGVIGHAVAPFDEGWLSQGLSARFKGPARSFGN